MLFAFPHKGHHLRSRNGLALFSHLRDMRLSLLLQGTHLRQGVPNPAHDCKPLTLWVLQTPLDSSRQAFKAVYSTNYVRNPICIGLCWLLDGFERPTHRKCLTLWVVAREDEVHQITLKIPSTRRSETFFARLVSPTTRR